MAKKLEAPKAAPPAIKTSIKLSPGVATQLDATLARFLELRKANGQWGFHVTKVELLRMALVALNARFDAESKSLPQARRARASGP